MTAYTVKAGEAGFYSIEDSSLQRATNHAGSVELLVFVRRANVATNLQTQLGVYTTVSAGELFDFDTFLGYLDVGDSVFVALGPDGDSVGDETEIDFNVVRAPELPVSVLADDLGVKNALKAPGEWSVLANVAQNSVAGRVLGWKRLGGSNEPAYTRTEASVHLGLPAGNGEIKRETMVALRVPQSGYYALHDAWAAPANGAGGGVESRVYVGTETSPRKIVTLTGRTSLNTDVGYVEKGDVIYLAFGSTGGGDARVELNASVAEWAPRRAPLRVRRGPDGLLDVFEPADTRCAVDIPTPRWVEIPHQSGDVTEVIRKAITKAQSLRNGDEYVGVRFESGKTYTIASSPADRTPFPIRNAKNLVIDGNGATLLIGSREIERADVSLFSVNSSRNIVFADFTVTATTIPFTTGEILEVTPPGANTQIVKFRVDPGALDPLRDIRSNGRGDAYAYDPKTPGRLALGSWTHYPGSGENQIQATTNAGIYTHRVTRTMDSIKPGGKWLIKNKGGGVTYLTTRGNTENITLSGIDGRACGGGSLRFWQTSGVNILDCGFEPDGENWISSSADGIHGRGREGVWVENTLIRGVCEDVMNTYGQSMAVVADDSHSDVVMSIRMLEGNVESSGNSLRVPTSESIASGDQLVFFNPKTGRVLGYSMVRSMAEGRYTMSSPVADIDTWEKGDGKSATMVYNTRAAGRFFIRDSRVMDSMRFGVYIKARGGVVFNSQFEGLSAPSIFAVNEPEWPEGPPATHLWVQGCLFSQNNYGFMPRNRDFMVVDPADISVYTRRLRDRSEPDDFRANLTRNQYANSHMKFIGNVFHDWRGMGISVRNSHNVQIADNLFLPPVNDDVMRKTLSEDRALNLDGRGVYAAMFLDSVNGVRVSGNRSYGLSGGDRALVKDKDVSGVIEMNNTESQPGGATTSVCLSFDEWFGKSSVEAASTGSAVDKVELGSATHRAGRLGPGLFFDGGAPATMSPSADLNCKGSFTIALWAAPEPTPGREQVAYAQGDARNGAVIAIDRGRWTVGLWQDGRGAWLDLGPAVEGLWQHIAFSLAGASGELRGYINGTQVASINIATHAIAVPATVSFGGLVGSTRLGLDRELVAGAGAYHGGVDEFRFIQGPVTLVDIAALALRRSD